MAPSASHIKSADYSVFFVSWVIVITAHMQLLETQNLSGNSHPRKVCTKRAVPFHFSISFMESVSENHFFIV